MLCTPRNEAHFSSRYSCFMFNRVETNIDLEPHCLLKRNIRNFSDMPRWSEKCFNFLFIFLDEPLLLQSDTAALLSQQS